MVDQVGLQSGTLYDTISVDRLRQAEADSQGELGQADFLSLMTAQLQNQDPMAPMENGEFIAQMAQFSMVSGIDQMNNSMGSLADSMQSNRALEASIMVGKEVLAPTDRLSISGEGSVSGGVDLKNTVSDLSIQISKPNGELVQTLQLGPQGQGIARFSWDGKDTRGNPVSPGNYVVSASTKLGSESSTAQTLIRGNVNSVTMGGDAGGMMLNVAGVGQVTLGQIKEISA